MDQPTDAQQRRSMTISIRSTRGKENIAEQPSVGIFWGMATSERWVLINEMTTLADSEDYGDFLTYPSGHFEIWEPLTRMPLSQLELSNLPALILGKEYEDFPRGRVVFNKPNRLFTIYADRRLQHPAIIQAVCRACCLATQTYVVRSDEHYR